MKADMRSGAGAEPGLDVAGLYLDQRDRLRRLAYLMTGDADAADDVVQDAFARSQQRLDEVTNPEAYLRTTVTNLCLSWRRRRAMARQRVPHPDRTSVDPPEIDETWALLARLPAKLFEDGFLGLMASCVPRDELLSGIVTIEE